MPCTQIATDASGGACSLTTTFDALLPGSVTEGDRAVWQLGAFEVLDGGADGDVQTHPNATFARQGLFVPWDT